MELRASNRKMVESRSVCLGSSTKPKQIMHTPEFIIAWCEMSRQRRIGSGVASSISRFMYGRRRFTPRSEPGDFTSQPGALATPTPQPL